jgi:hypothetical protein
MLLLLAIACASPTPDTGGPARWDTGSPQAGDTGDGLLAVAKWQVLVFMNGDNNLEDYVPHDLNELEQTGSGDGVEVLVQADRTEGYSTKDGDWTGVRRYRIERDEDLGDVSSPVIEELGELDMGAPEVLADFLAWAADSYPAERRVLVMWNHGDGWLLQDPEGAPPPPGISYDDTDGGFLSFARGSFADGVRADVEANGKLDVIGFDACNMASWEVMHAIAPFAHAASAAETSVGYEGLQYGPMLAWLRANPAAAPRDLAHEMSRAAVEEGGEQSFSAIDLDAIAPLSAAIDGLAGAALADPALAERLYGYRTEARGADRRWKNWYLDLGDLANITAAAGEPALSPLAADLSLALGGAVVAAYGDDDFGWTSGLTIWFDPWDEYLELYADGAGATWSQDTRWGELMRVYAAD